VAAPRPPSGSFWRDGLEVCRVVAFEDLGAGNPHNRDGDFDVAVVALNASRLDAADLAAIETLLFG